jgi:hypothetical protein
MLRGACYGQNMTLASAPPSTAPPDGLDSARSHRLHASGQALLHDIARRVRAGYTWHVGGEVPAPKVLGLVAKLSAAHGTHLDRLTRHRSKAAGEPAAVLFVWPVRNDPTGHTTAFRFLLLGTEPLDGERMQDGRHKPVRCNLYPGDAAELHLEPTRRPWQRGESRKGAPPVVYEWRLAPRALVLMRERLAVAARSEASQLQQAVAAYSALPMTGPYRFQLREALTAVRPIWRANQRPSVQALRQRIKAGQARDPLGPPPFMFGFPTMYAEPPETLADHLAAAARIRGEVRRQQTRSQRALHAAVATPDDTQPDPSTDPQEVTE